MSQHKQHITLSVRLTGSLLLIVLTLALTEAASYLIWRWRDGPAVLALYSDQIETAKSYTYNKNFKLLFPKPDIDFVTADTEYTDRFRTKDILGNGLGFFDDGIDVERQHKAIALGDSFTRGVGSSDNLTNGWVELIEKKLPWLDLVNFGWVGSGQVQQFVYYEQLNQLFDHKMVLLNLFAGTDGDFFDNLAYSNINEITDYVLRAGGNPDSFIKNLQYYWIYSPADEYLSSAIIPLHSIWLFIKVLDKVSPDLLVPKTLKTTFTEYTNIRKLFYDKRPNLLRHELINGRTTLTQNGFVYRIGKQYYDKNFADRLAAVSATYINEFNKKLKGRGIHMILVIHPGFEQVYLQDYKPTDGREFDPDYIVHSLISKVAPSIPYHILAADLRHAASHSKEPLYHPLDQHYNKTGYALVADSISRFLCSSDAKIRYSCSTR